MNSLLEEPNKHGPHAAGDVFQQRECLLTLRTVTASVTTVGNVSHFCNLRALVSVNPFCAVIRNVHKQNILSQPLKGIIIVNIGAPPTEYHEPKFLCSCPFFLLFSTTPTSRSPSEEQRKIVFPELPAFIYVFHYFYFLLFPILLNKVFQPMQKIPLLALLLFTRGNQLITYY